MGYIGSGPTRFNTADELTVTGDAEFNGNLTVKGTTTTIDSASVQTVDLGDNDKIRLGDGDDLQIYHDGFNSFVNDLGTGNLIMRGANVSIQDASANNQVFVNNGGAVDIRYAGSAKLATTATGVDVTGTVTADGLTVEADGTHIYLKQTNGDFGHQFRQANDGGALQIGRNVNGTFTEAMRLDSSGRVGIGTSSPATTLETRITGNGLPATSGTTPANVALRLSSTLTTGIIDMGLNSANPWIQSTDRTNLSVPYNLLLNPNGGDVGIGTSSPTLVGFGSGANGLEIADATLAAIRLNGNAADSLYFVSGSSKHWIFGRGAVPLTFSTNGTERMRITSAGNVHFGCTSFPSASVAGFTINGTSSGNASSSGASTAAYNHLLFYNGNGLVGYISTSGSTTSFANISDYRLKTAVTYDWDATTRLKQLRPARFEWIADGDDAVPVDGFLAHEVQDVVPEAITGTKDAMRDEEYEVTPAVLDEDGNETTPAVMGTRSVPDYQGIDQSKLVPLLVKTIQELEARITALETA